MDGERERERKTSRRERVCVCVCLCVCVCVWLNSVCVAKSADSLKVVKVADKRSTERKTTSAKRTQQQNRERGQEERVGHSKSFSSLPVLSRHTDVHTHTHTKTHRDTHRHTHVSTRAYACTHSNTTHTHITFLIYSLSLLLE